jgi:hypothetical protein
LGGGEGYGELLEGRSCPRLEGMMEVIAVVQRVQTKGAFEAVM